MACRPQKGRYREFYQCDADVVGTDSLLCEVELLQLIDEVFARLGIRVAIKLNNRKVLAGIAELIGAPERIVDITVAIDKLDKIGRENVNAELIERGLSPEAVDTLQPILDISGTTDERMARLQELLVGSETGAKGVEELRTVIDGTRATLDLDVSLARGLNYYTGTIIEVKALDTPIGSITGGGRYDNLTGVFGAPGLSGVGISFGADRIYDVMTTLNLFPEGTDSGAQVMFANLGVDEAAAALRLAAALRRQGIAVEVYPDAAKMKKQMAWADAAAVPYVAIIGSNELATGTVTLRNMRSGDQSTVSAADIDVLAATIKA